MTLSPVWLLRLGIGLAPVIIFGVIAAKIYGAGVEAGENRIKKQIAIIKQELRKKEQEFNNQLEAARNEADKIKPTPRNDRELMRLCKRAGSGCRDNK